MPDPARRPANHGEELRLRPGDQPLPVTDDPAAPGAHDAVIALLSARKQVGLSRYGTTLQPHNGRRTARDLVEELADGIVYAQTLEAEVNDLEELLTRWVREYPGPAPALWDASRELLARRGVVL